MLTTGQTLHQHQKGKAWSFRRMHIHQPGTGKLTNRTSKNKRGGKGKHVSNNEGYKLRAFTFVTPKTKSTTLDFSKIPKSKKHLPAKHYLNLPILHKSQEKSPFRGYKPQ